MKRSISLVFATLGLSLSTQSSALTIITLGGATGDAMQSAYFTPFAQSTGHGVTAGEYNEEISRIRAMVETGNVSWDIVEIGSPELMRGCYEGLFEPIDWSRIPVSEYLLPEAKMECGVGTFVWSTVLAYDASRFNEGPKGWQDFWNITDFPGKRGLRRGAKYTLEFALMADGVGPSELYEMLATEEGVARAFAKLDEIKDHVQWWEAGAQPAQWLVAGDVVMSSAYNGRIAVAQDEGRNLGVVWSGSIYDLDYWAIVQGSGQLDTAYEFISFASQPEGQALFSQQISYGPVHPEAIAGLELREALRMPTHEDNLKNALGINTDFWVDYGEELEQRFNAWAAR